MLKKVLLSPYNGFKSLYYKQIDGIGLEVFRVLFFSCLLGDVVTLYKYDNLIFDRIPYLLSYELTLWPALVLWIIAVFSIVIGFKTRLALVLNYMFCVVFIANIQTYEYHMYYVYVSISAVAMFVPLGQSFSIDRLIHKKGADGDVRRTASAFYYFILVFTGIGLTYFDSIFHKLNAQIWLKGLGVWLPSSIPHIVVRDFTPILNQSYLMLLLGYLTLVFEAVFIFIFWMKRVRVPLFVIGLGLHIGITLIYPIPYFGLGMSALYLLLVPVSLWRKLAHKLGLFLPARSFSFSGSNRSTELSKIRMRLGFAGTVALLLLQSVFIYYSPVGTGLKNRAPLLFYIPSKILDPISLNIREKSSRFLGLHQHGVFVDGHFMGYDHNISIRYKGEADILLPLSQESGMVGPYQTGPLWAKWGFRVNAPRVDSTRLVQGMRDFTLQWMHDEELPFDNQSFELIMKRNEVPTEWTKDFLKNQLNAPWEKIGAFKWEDEKMVVQYIDFENIYSY